MVCLQGRKSGGKGLEASQLGIEGCLAEIRYFPVVLVEAQGGTSLRPPGKIAGDVILGEAREGNVSLGSVSRRRTCRFSAPGQNQDRQKQPETFHVEYVAP